MATIKVGFSRPRKWWKPFSLLIRLFTWAPYSHTYIRFYSSKYDRWLVYQASNLIVNFVGPKAWEEEAFVVREFDLEVSDETVTKVVSYAIDNAGQPYDLMSVFGIATVKIASLFGRRIANPLGNGRGFFCSELVGEILVEIVGEKIREDLAIITPRDIYEYLESMQETA